MLAAPGGLSFGFLSAAIRYGSLIIQSPHSLFPQKPNVFGNLSALAKSVIFASASFYFAFAHSLCKYTANPVQEFKTFYLCSKGRGAFRA